MKDISMPTEAAAGLAMKAGAALGVGALGAIIIAAVDPPKTKRELFLQALTAGAGSLVFGPLAVRLLDHYADFVDLSTVGALELLEWTAPVYFVLGALSWGAFGALGKLRGIIRERGAEKVAGKVGL